ncbi:MAG TPA: alpha-ketoglutarate-dependent dioxygenase AlkB [Steroidobacteraceae bacterium]|nr:alpha-ketoglutarate-dependent dioxygenase AlkB [Steroidobacteraceae bacterium]
MMRQDDLFGAPPRLPAGFEHRADFLAVEEEAALLQSIATLDFQQASYRQWTARRRIVSFGGSYDFTHNRLHPAAALPQFLHALRDRMAAWVCIEGAQFTHATIAEYPPGTPLGWHRDVPDFEVVAGVSLQGMARMRFRPYPPAEGWTRAILYIDLAPRSAYIIRDAARWQWQHSISPTKELRYSITFRTLRDKTRAA